MIYVSLDLGSESMAAYYWDPVGDGKMIQMQSKAKNLLGLINSPDSEIDFLMDESGIKPSARLLNIISLKDNVQPQSLSDEHAKLIYADQASYDASLFKLFYRVASRLGNDKILPNPKILFQHQVKSILPNVEANDGGFVDLSPLLLIRHLTLQIVNNLVLNSDELRQFDRKEIHLTITVPNIYSLPHVESIKEFIKQNINGIGGIDVISESDAIAYYVLASEDSENDPEDLKIFKRDLHASLIKNQKQCIVTIDVGKGTTDLSCILKRKPRNDSTEIQGFFKLWQRKNNNNDRPVQPGKPQHFVKGKTGKSSGGNYLNYLFAEYYHNRLVEAAPAIHHSTGKMVPFYFLTIKEESHKQNQSQAVSALEKLIEHVKRNMTEDYEIDERALPSDVQIQLINSVVKYMIIALDPVAAAPDWKDTAQEFEDFRQQIIDVLFLPQKLDRSGWRRIFNRWSKPLPTQPLKESLEKYVKENADDLLESLKKQVEEHRIKIKDENGKIIKSERAEIDRNTFAVISGQASQFRPLREEIVTKCKTLHIKEDNIYRMTGKDSKEACCKGAVYFKIANMLHVNQNELQGTYGCLSVIDQTFKAFNMDEIKLNGKSTVTFDSPTAYYIVFTPRGYHETELLPPKRNDGATSIIALIEEEYKFTLDYDETNLELKVNDTVLELKTFGNVDGSIYPKVWPEVLKPENS